MKLSIRADRFIANDKEVCEELYTKFQEIFTLEQEEVPEIRERIVDQEPLEEFEITSGNVRKLLLELDMTEAIGLDGISSWILKEGAVALGLPLSIVYNKSLLTRQLPKIWKTAIEVPIFMKGVRQRALNYWPVFLTCISCKLTEKIARK
ncbi:uncharacterized protein [Procambarus clarkii]|uniref:uncharacterized protein n=1 Tax=Procambarus clarkii TaxID=6728 RepID=UPI0037448E20